MATAGMRFCQECNNMLYPKEDKELRILNFACRNCGHSQEVEERCIYVNEIVKDNRTHLDIIPNDIIDDPTLQRSDTTECQACGHHGAVFFQAHDGAKESTLGLIFVCCNPDCVYKWLD